MNGMEPARDHRSANPRAWRERNRAYFDAVHGRRCASCEPLREQFRQ